MKAEFDGFNEFAKKLNYLSGDAVLKSIAGKVLYAGAGVLADAVRSNIKKIPIFEGHGSPDFKMDGITRSQKAGLLSGFGIAALKKRGDTYDVHIGFDGYNSYQTRRYPNGQPNILIARSVEGGTSFRNPRPFFMPAIRTALGEAENNMTKVFNETIEEEMR